MPDNTNTRSAIVRDLDAVAALDPCVVFCALVGLPEWHPVFIAARLSVEVAEARRVARRQLREASRDVRAAADWPAMLRNHIEYAELQRRRAQPAQTGGAA